MKADTRRQEIMDLMMELGNATVDDLASRFGVSKMTVHRDLDELEQSGLLRKVRGGASIQSKGRWLGRKGDSSALAAGAPFSSGEWV